MPNGLAMVVLDPETDDVVIRVVYDGPPEAGKTTSVRALAGSLGRQMYTPDQVGGRTVYFDWLDYTGGLFEGHRIRCQVVSVPGQATLAPRRRALLQQADVVVFVADTRRPHLEGLPAYLSGLARILSAAAGPPVGLVVQANKRDLPGSVPIADLRRLLEDVGLRVGVLESVATDGVGIREAFVFAVRLALDRTREALRAGGLRSARPAVDSGEELLERLRADEAGSLEMAVEDGLRHTRLHEVTMAGEALADAVASDQPPPEPGRVWPAEPEHEQPPRPPGAGVAGGLIWPPVNGRLMLHEADGAPVELARNDDGDWQGLAGGRWIVQSPAHSTFTDLDRGRAALVEWARVHSTSAGVLSGDRCIVLADDHRGAFRLWQLVRLEPSLAQRMDAAAGLAPREAARTIVECALTFLEAARVVPTAACRLPLTLAATRASRIGAPFVGLMPAPSFVRPPEACPRAVVEGLLARELRPYLEALAPRRALLLALLESFPGDGPAGAACGLVRSLWTAL